MKLLVDSQVVENVLEEPILVVIVVDDVVSLVAQQLRFHPQDSSAA